MKGLHHSLIRRFVSLLLAAIVVNTLVPVAGHARDLRKLPGDAQAGAGQWAANCGRCHRLRSPTDYRDDEWEPIVSHMRVRAQLTGQEARNILAFLQIANSPTLPLVAREQPVTGNHRPMGEVVYRQTCQACHGERGQGALPGVPNFTRPSGPLSKADAELLLHIRNGFQSPGSAMAMPAKGGNPALSEDQLQAVLDFLRSEFGGQP